MKVNVGDISSLQPAIRRMYSYCTYLTSLTKDIVQTVYVAGEAFIFPRQSDLIICGMFFISQPQNSRIPPEPL